MQIKIDLKLFIVVLIFLLTRQLDIYIILMLFAILHEFGHLIVGVILGFKPKRIEILPVGVSACFYTNCQNYNEKVECGNKLALKKIVISLAGPIANLSIAVICAFLNCPILGLSVQFLVYANILIGIFNLIPIYPLDGGRIIKNIVHIKWGLKKSYKCIYFISNVTIILLTAISSIAVLYLKNISILIILIYLWGLVITQNKIYNSKMQIYRLIDEVENNKMT